MAAAPFKADALRISRTVAIPLSEIELSAVRAQGAGGQNVNKVATAVHLRFDIHASSLPERYKASLLARRARRITRDGIVIIKAQRSRSQEKNRAAALARLQALVHEAGLARKTRRPTKPTLGAKRKRLDAKIQRGKTKALRRRPL